eukprot:jgi/Bigna1/78920/fgenesh1_pg.58_\
MSASQRTDWREVGSSNKLGGDLARPFSSIDTGISKSFPRENQFIPESKSSPPTGGRNTPEPPKHAPISPPKSSNHGKDDESKLLGGGHGKSADLGGRQKSDDGKDLALLDPLKYPVKRGQEELQSIEKTIQLINKRDPTLLKRYRSDPHKISRVVMREVRPKNGFNHEKAARFYQETVEWRESFHCEHMLRHPPGKLHIMNMLMPELNFGCVDKEGYPVLFMRFGLSTGKQVLARLSAQEVAMCHAYCLDMMELMCRMQTKRTGRWIDKMRVVIDFQNISIFAIRDFLGFAKRCAHMDTTYYTGLMMSTHLINVPASLSWATALFWPFISAGVKRKVFLFTTGFEPMLQKLAWARCAFRGFSTCLTSYDEAYPSGVAAKAVWRQTVWIASSSRQT